MWIQRAIEAVILARAATRPGLVITGARQAGKTSLVRRLFPDHHYVSLDLPSEAALAELAPEEFLARHPAPLIVDEVQYAPGLFRHLKTRIDAERGKNGRYILTGSQPFPLMKSVSESLAGRVDVIEVEGLSWREIHAARKGATWLDVMLRGGFPELQARPGIDAQSYFHSYVATYLERDLRQVLRVGDLREFERFLRACALRTGQVLNKADLARDVGVSSPTASTWLSALAASHQVVLLEPWFRNAGKSLVKAPKLFLADTGLCAFLCGIRGPEDLVDSPLRGALWETFVFSELRRRGQDRAGGGDLFYWRDRSREVDFLRHGGGRFDLLEAKWAELPQKSDTAGLTAVAEILGPDKVRSRRVVCRCRNAHPITSDVRAVSPDDDWA